MKRIDDEYVDMLMSGKITKEKFLKLINVKEADLFDEIYEFINFSVLEESCENVEIAIHLIFLYNLNSNAFVKIFNNMLISDWHEEHENLAILLQQLRNESSVKYLYEAIGQKHDYLEWDYNHAFEVKCIWALGDIGNVDAKEKLSFLLNSDIDIIRTNAQKQLDRLS